MLRVLLVDDDPELRAILELALTGLPGVALTPAESGEQALALARSSPADLLLTDYKMDGMTGLQLLLELRRENLVPRLGSVMLSGDDDETLPERAKAAGAREFWRKPVSPAKLRRFVSELAAATAGE